MHRWRRSGMGCWPVVEIIFKRRTIPTTFHPLSMFNLLSESRLNTGGVERGWYPANPASLNLPFPVLRKRRFPGHAVRGRCGHEHRYPAQQPPSSGTSECQLPPSSGPTDCQLPPSSWPSDCQLPPSSGPTDCQLPPSSGLSTYHPPPLPGTR